MLPRKNRLKAKHIKGLYDRGLKSRGQYGMLISQKDSTVEEYEVSFVVSKKIGNAVQRHRMTRLLREISRKNLKEGINGYKFVYVAFKYCNEYEQLEKDFNQQLQKSVSNT